MLLFCRDGVLRRSHGYYDEERDEHISSITPLRAFEIVDPHIFLKCLNNVVRFEEGLTVLELFENLAPWDQTMIGVACMDFPAFLKEARKQEDLFEDMDRVEISYHTELKVSPRFKESRLEFKLTEDSRFLELIPSDPEVSDILEIEAHWSSKGCYKEPKYFSDIGRSEDSCSLDMSPISRWSHLRITISNKAQFIDRTPFDTDHLSDKKPITNHCHGLAKTEVGDSENLISIGFPLEAPLPTFYDTIVHGFLWKIGFFYSPATRDETTEELRKQIASLDSNDNAYESIYEEHRRRERAFEKEYFETVLGIASKLDLSPKSD